MIRPTAVKLSAVTNSTQAVMAVMAERRAF